MNKEAFLEKLKEYLGILEDEEQKDILEEYAQHIDMKMQKGLSEEEAIQDFGSMEELAAQILEAYHVKPQFREKRKAINFSKPKGKPADTGKETEKLWKNMLVWIKEKTVNVGRHIKHAFSWMGRKCHTFGGWLGKPFRQNKMKMDDTAGEKRTKEKGAKAMTMKTGIGSVFKTIGNGIVSLCRMCYAFCIWCLKIFWNVAWLMFSLICAFMVMITLMGVGMIAVLLFQGYPFIGIFFLCLGGMLCFGALSCGAFSLLIRKKEEKNQKDKEAEKADGEVQYE